MIFESIGDWTRFKNGFIHIESASTKLDAPILTMDADDDVQILADTSATLTGTTMNVVAGNLAKFDARQSITLASTATGTFQVPRLSVVNNQDVNALTFNTDNLLSSHSTSATYTIATDIDVRSQSYVSFDIYDGNFIGALQTYKSAAGDIDVTATGALGVTAGSFFVKGESADSVSSVQGGAAGVAVTVGTFLDVDAFDSIWLPMGSITATDLTTRSAGDVIFESPSQTFRGDGGLLLFATADGIIDIKSFGTLGVNSGALNFRAEGDLGSQGGRYVLEDFYFSYDPRIDRNHKVNVNTNSMEFVAVNGPFTATSTLQMDYSACQGSIEARAARTIRYFTCNYVATCNIFFYGLDDAPVGASDLLTPHGIHRVADAYTESVDYCASPLFQNWCVDFNGGTCGITCTALSQVIN